MKLFARGTGSAETARIRRRAADDRCRELLRRVDSPTKFSVAAFCGAVEAVTGRAIVLHPVSPGSAPPGLCGFVASTDSEDHVIFTRDGSLVGQATTIIHECGHILYGLTTEASGDVVEPGTSIPAQVLVAAPDLAHEPIRRIRGRGGFSVFEEEVVETFAATVLERALQNSSAEPGVDRLSDNFG